MGLGKKDRLKSWDIEGKGKRRIVNSRRGGNG